MKPEKEYVATVVGNKVTIRQGGQLMGSASYPWPPSDETIQGLIAHYRSASAHVETNVTITRAPASNIRPQS